MIRASLFALTMALFAISAAPSVACAQDHQGDQGDQDDQADHAQPRVMLGVEGALLFAVSEPERDRFHAGGTLAVASHFSLTKWLMPVARLRFGLLSAGSMPDARDSGLGHLGSLQLGVRFRPRGIAHPEEPSRASCVWAEANAGASLWNGELTPSFEAAVGFLFLVRQITFGPVVRLLHVLPVAPEDGANVLLMTVGLELLINDAR